MTIWIGTLRLLGIGIFVLGVVGGFVKFSQSDFSNASNLIDSYVFIFECAALAILCFSAAAALTYLRRMDQRIAQLSAGRRRQQGKTQSLDLAPVAPNWDDAMPAPRQPIIGRPAQRRIDRMINPTPIVKDQPPVSRETPGWTYADPEPPTPKPYQPKPEPRPTRHTLQRARDNQLRRQRGDLD